MTYFVLTDLRVTVDNKHTKEETSKQYWEGQCLDSAFEQLLAGTLTIDPLLICTLHVINSTMLEVKAMGIDTGLHHEVPVIQCKRQNLVLNIILTS